MNRGGRAWARDQRAPQVVLALVLLLTVMAALIVTLFVRQQQRSRFEREAQVVTSAIRERISNYDRLLRTARAAWEGNPQLLNEGRFNDFVRGVELANRYPGVQAMGYAVWLPDGNTAALLTFERRNGQTTYALREGDSPQPMKAPIAVVAPATAQNLSAMGFDLYSEANRRDAINRAIRTNDTEATRPLKLVQRDAQGRPLPGFLMMLPVWQDVAHTTPAGVIYLAIHADTFLQGLNPDSVGSGLLRQVELGGERLGGPAPTGVPTFADEQRFTVLGQPWRLAYGASGQFGQDFAATLPLLTLLAGLFISGLAFLVVRAQVQARAEAEALNDSLNVARVKQDQARAEFEAIFQSMQDAAVFTDQEGRVRLVNRAFGQQFLVTEGDVIGRPLSHLHLDHRLDDRDTFQALTTLYARQDGSEFSGEGQRSEVVDPQGQRLGLLEVVRDVTERIAAERAVQNGERRYRSMLDAVPLILKVSDPQGDVTYVNAQYQRLLGEQRLTERLAPDDRNEYADLWQRALATREGVSTEMQVQLVDRQWRWYQVRLSPMRDTNGDLTEWVTSANDIHDRLLAERLAQRNEERYRGVLEGLPQIVWLIDAHGEHVYFNRRWAEYVGDAQVNAGFLNLIHPDDRAAYQQRWQQAARATRPFEAEHRLLSASGVYRHFVTRGQPVLDGHGQLIEWIGTSTDVDDSVYAESAARLLAEVTEQLAARTGSDLSARHEVYRKALRKITERFVETAGLWSAAPLKLLASSQMHPNWQQPHMQAAIRQAVSRVLETQDPMFIPSHPLLHSVNTTGAVLFPLPGREGVPSGVLGLSYRSALTTRDQDLAHELAKRFTAALENDALQQKVNAAQEDLKSLNQSLEERVQRRTTELEAANRELEAFSYSVSHDLRSPLRHIVGFGELLARDSTGQLSPKGQRYLGIITESATRMSQLIDDLLEFSRMGRQELRAVPVNLHDLIRESWAALEPDVQGRDVALHVDPNLPTVVGDPSLLGQVFTNLLSNAVKYTRQNPQAVIQVRAQVSGAEVSLSVQDNGVGFDPRYADKLFGVFQRLHRAEEFEGIGIGLANVRRIVNRHGGQVTADAAPGKGATFTVTLPLAAPDGTA